MESIDTPEIDCLYQLLCYLWAKATLIIPSQDMLSDGLDYTYLVLSSVYFDLTAGVNPTQVCHLRHSSPSVIIISLRGHLQLHLMRWKEMWRGAPLMIEVLHLRGGTSYLGDFPEHYFVRTDQPHAIDLVQRRTPILCHRQSFKVGQSHTIPEGSSNVKARVTHPQLTQVQM